MPLTRRAIPKRLDPGPGLVAKEDACPHCEEDQMDCLVWQDDETIKCLTCGETYTPPTR